MENDEIPHKENTVEITHESDPIERVQRLQEALQTGRRIVCKGSAAERLQFNFAAGAKSNVTDLKPKLDMSRRAFPESIYFEHCEFIGEVDCSYSHFEQTLQFHHCIFAESLTLRGARVDCSLYVDHSEVHLPPEYDPNVPERQTFPYESPPDDRSAKWNALRVRGNIRARKLRVFGSLNLGGAHVQGNLYLQGCNIGSFDDPRKPEVKIHQFLGRLYMRQARISGDLELGPLIPVERDAEATPSIICGTFSLGSSIINGRLTLRGARIGGCVHGIMAHVSGRVLADCWRHPDDPKQFLRTIVGHLESDGNAVSIDFHDTTFEKAVWLNGMLTTGEVTFENAKIGGSLRLDCWYRRVPDPAAETENNEVNADGTRPPAGRRGIQSEEKESVLPARSTTPQPVPHPTEFVERLKKQIEAQDKRNKCRVEYHELNYNSESGVSLPLKQFFPTEIGAGKDRESLILRNAHIHANLEMYGIQTAGRIACHGTTINGNLHCAPFECEYEDRNEGHATRIIHYCYRPVVGKNRQDKSLSLYGARIDGNVEFRGTQFHGAVRMRYIRVGGAVEGNSYIPEEKNEKGKVRLRYPTEIGVSEHGHGLYLYGAIIDGNICCKELVVKGQLSLELATIKGRVELDRSEIGEQAIWPTNIKEQVRRKWAFSMELAQISNSLNIDGMRVWGGIHASGMTVGGDLEANDIVRRSKRSESRGGDTVLTMTAGVPDGSAAGENDVLGELSVLGIAGSAIAGDLTLACSGFSEIDAKGLTVGDKAEVILGDFGCFDISGSTVKHLTLELSILESEASAQSLPIPHSGSAATHDQNASEGPKLNFCHAKIGSIEIHGFDPKSRWVSPPAARVEVDLDGLAFHHLAFDPENEEEFTVSYHSGKKRIYSATAQRVSGLVFAIFLLTVIFKSFILTAEHSSQAIWMIVAIIVLSAMFYENSARRNKGRTTFRLAPLARKLMPISIVISVALVVCIWQWGPDWAISWTFWPLFYACCALIWGDFMRAIGRVIRQNRESQHAAFLALTETFSTAPYLDVCQILDRCGDVERSEHVYLAMRQRELILGSGFRKLFRWIFYVLSGSGVRVRRLCFFLLAYFIFSWLAVFSNPDSVEHPSVFEPLHRRERWTLGGKTDREAKEWDESTGKPPGRTWQQLELAGKKWPFVDKAFSQDGESNETDSSLGHLTNSVQPGRFPAREIALFYGEEKAKAQGFPKQQFPTAINNVYEDHRQEPSWGLQDGFWMAAKVHVPLLHLFWKEKWTPSSRICHYYSPFGMTEVKGYFLGMGKAEIELEYETYAAIAQIISYLTLPMLISAIGGFYKKDSASHGHGHAGGEH